MSPLIGVTRGRGASGLIQNLFIRLCLKLSGAHTTNLTVSQPNFDLEIDGLVISGGTDLYPDLYHSTEIKHEYQYDRERDKLELAWLKKAKNKRVPILCICRGAQLLNVFRGGTLHTDVAKVFEDAEYPSHLLAKIFYRKKIRITKDTTLEKVFDKSETEVNSLHSQAINDLGDDLVVSAKEDNGVVQAVENEGKRFIMGVQFHPEFLYYRSDVRALFKEFVEASRELQLTRMSE